MVTIYHNPRCSKSRQALELLRNQNIEPEVVEYLKDVPTEAELKALLKKLAIPAESLVRKKEKDFIEHFKGKQLPEAEWVKAMIRYPKLIERPIVVKGDKAVVGRPPEKVLSLL